MDTQEKSQFINNYTKLLIAAWSDESLSDRLVLDPKGVLAQFGLAVPDDAKVEIVRQIPPDHGEPNEDFQINLWEEGQTSGYYELHVPQTPQIDMSEIDESELEAVAGGWSISCCCCSPCCSCA